MLNTQKAIRKKKTEAAGNLIDNKMAAKISKVLRISPQNNSETVEI